MKRNGPDTFAKGSRKQVAGAIAAFERSQRLGNKKGRRWIPTAMSNANKQKGRGLERTHGLSINVSVYQATGALRQGKATALPLGTRTRQKRVMQTTLIMKCASLRKMMLI